MSLALAKAGVVTEGQSRSVATIPHNLQPYRAEIEEIDYLESKLKEAGVKDDFGDTATRLLFAFDVLHGRLKEAIQLRLEHARDKARIAGLI